MNTWDDEAVDEETAEIPPGDLVPFDDEHDPDGEPTPGLNVDAGPRVPDDAGALTEGRTGAVSAAASKRCARLPLTEAGFAERVEAHLAGTLAWHPTRETWLHFNGRLWEPQTSESVRLQVLDVVRSVGEVETAFITDTDRRSSHRSMALSMESKAHLDAIGNVARGFLTVGSARWDTHPTLLNTPSGTWDLSTGLMREHRATDYLTQITSGSGDLRATSSQLDRVLADLAEMDPELPKFVQRIAGLGVTGLTADVFVHAWGAAGAGKTTLYSALVAALGDGAAGTSYASVLPAAVVLKGARQGTGEEASPALDQMRGARFVFVDEFEKGQADVALIKGLTGGAPLRTRSLHKNGSTWRPIATIVAAGNERAHVPSDDEGFGRRLLPIEYIRPPEGFAGRIDPMVRVVLVDSVEGQDAVLAWAIRGAIELLDGRTAIARSDLNEPASVVRGRGEYLGHSDPLAAWLEASTEFIRSDPPNSGLCPTIDEVFRSYQCYKKAENTRYVLSQKEFTRRIGELPGVGVTDRTRRQRGWSERRGRFVVGLRIFADSRGDYATRPPLDPSTCSACAREECGHNCHIDEF